jgi:hypothetical protein
VRKGDKPVGVARCQIEIVQHHRYCYALSQIEIDQEVKLLLLLLHLLLEKTTQFTSFKKKRLSLIN